jgi:hypothetical protein
MNNQMNEEAALLQIYKVLTLHLYIRLHGLAQFFFFYASLPLFSL